MAPAILLVCRNVKLLTYLRVRSNSNEPIRVDNETAVVADLFTSLWGKPKRRILRQYFFVFHESFDRRSKWVWSETYWALWNCWFYFDSVLLLLRRKRFVWPAMDGVVVSNNFTKRHQNGSKIGTREKFAIHLRWENFISNEIVIYTIFVTIGDFPKQFSIYT